MGKNLFLNGMEKYRLDYGVRYSNISMERKNRDNNEIGEYF